MSDAAGNGILCPIAIRDLQCRRAHVPHSTRYKLLFLLGSGLLLALMTAVLLGWHENVHEAGSDPSGGHFLHLLAVVVGVYLLLLLLWQVERSRIKRFSRTILNNIPVAVVVFDSEGNVKEQNLAAVEVAERTRLSGGRADDLFSLIVKRLGTLSNVTAPVHFEQHVKDLWYQVDVKPFSVPTLRSDGGWAISVLEITTRKRNEFRIMESEARLEEAHRIGRLGSFTLYHHSREMDWSHQMYALHGLSAVQLAPDVIQYQEMVHPGDREAVVALFETAIAGGELKQREFRVQLPDGGERWLRVDGRLLFDERQQVHATFATAVDITEMKTREAELRALLERNRMLTQALESSPGGLAVITSDASEPVLFYANREFSLLTGIIQDENNYPPLSGLWGPESSQEAVERILSALREQRSARVEMIVYRQPDTPFLARLAVSPIHGGLGQVTAFVVSLADISIERSQAELQRQSQKMEALGQLAGGVAHEINNLLQPVLTLSEIGGATAAKNPAQTEEYFEIILDCARKARDVVRRVLSFARSESGRAQVASLVPLVVAAAQLSKNTLPSDVQLEVMTEEQDLLVAVSPTEVSQVLLNLISNSVFALGQSGRIELGVQQMKITARRAEALDLPAGQYVKMSVSDNGPGMSEYVKSKAFDPFFTTKALGEGTGLGLAVVFGIVKGWKGAIEIVTGVGRGTSVDIYIPLVSA